MDIVSGRSLALDLKNELLDLRDASAFLSSKGWAKGSSGNISLLSSCRAKGALPVSSVHPFSPFRMMMTGRYVWVTRTGSRMQDLSHHPLENLGLYRIAEEELELVFGSGPPSSEVRAHLSIYDATDAQAVVHCHMEWIGTEDVPSGKPIHGFCMLPRAKEGSLDLAMSTAEAAPSFHTMIWQGHGALALGKDLEECLDRLSTLDRWHSDRMC